jgi:polyvinyl alcohol dehydrogenase (cytochrome)
MRDAHWFVPSMVVLAAIYSCGGDSGSSPAGVGGAPGVGPSVPGSMSTAPALTPGQVGPGAVSPGSAPVASVAGTGGTPIGSPDQPPVIPPPVPGTPAGTWTSFGGSPENTFSRPDAVFDVTAAMGAQAPGMAWTIPAPGVTGTPAIYDGVAYWWDIGDSTGGTFHATKIADGSMVWERDFPRGSTGSAFADATRVYIGDRDTTLRALNRMTGATEWEVKVSDNINGQLWSSPIIVDGILIIGMAGHGTGNGVGATTEKLRNFRGAVIAVNAQTGDKIWHFETTLKPDGTPSGPGAPVWSSAAVDPVRKHVYIGAGNSYYAPASKCSDSLLALDYSTTDPKGSLVWWRQFTANDNYTQMSPNGPDYDVGAAPTIFSAGGKDYVAVGDKGGGFYVLERDLKPDPAKPGENTIVWQQKLSNGGPTGGVMAPAAYRDGVLYVASNDSQRQTKLFALDAVTGMNKWGQAKMLPFITYGNILLTKDALLIGTSTGFANNTAQANVLAFHLDTGEQYPWRFPLPQQHGGGMSISNGTLLVGYGFHFLDNKQEPVLGGLMALRAGGVMGTPPVGGMEPAPATHAPTFKAVYNEVLVVQGCTSGCHDNTGLENLGDPATARANLLAATAHGMGCNAGQMMVVPGNPDQSLLVQKLRPNPPCGGQMPPGASLTQEEIDQVAMWIQLGAMDN